MNPPLVVPSDLAGQPLDEFLALHYPRIGKGRLRRMIRDGRITLDGIRVLPGVRVGEGQVVLVEVDPDELAAPEPGTVPLTLLHEDADFVAVDKPAGIPVEPSRWGEHPLHLSGTLLAWAEDSKRDDGAVDDVPDPSCSPCPNRAEMFSWANLIELASTPHSGSGRVA